MVQKLDESKRYEVRYRLITQQNVMVSILRPENINLKYHCMADLLCILCLDIVKTSFMYLGQTKLICEFKNFKKGGKVDLKKISAALPFPGMRSFSFLFPFKNVLV